MIDWSGCPDVERSPGKVSGQWIVVGTRILADGITEIAPYRFCLAGLQGGRQSGHLTCERFHLARGAASGSRWHLQ